jgi:S-(hydroxymethyl)glutathione dehydrogenase/alcohol dehydrogenase
VKSQAAVLYGLHQEWKIEEIDVGEPRRGEVLVNWKFAGLCHSDDHWVTGDVLPPENEWARLGLTNLFPVLGGHEGSGIVVEVADGVTELSPGDHVAASFVAVCGRCRYCSTGRQNLCNAGARTLSGGMITDGVHRHHLGDVPVTLMAKLGTYAEYTCVSENSLVKVEPDLPMDCVALVSCGVATGWGSATARASVRDGDVVVVVGVGGIGINAVQGARVAGARRVVAVDPVPYKLTRAAEFGATECFPSMEAALPAVIEMTRGQLADKVILSPSVMYGDLLQAACALAGKDSTVVVAAVAPASQTQVSLNLFELAMWNKEIKGTLFGSLNPRYDIPRLLQLYRDGRLKLDELITRRYPLEEINEGFRAMRAGENLRGVIAY